jgi:hypothetical protein
MIRSDGSAANVASLTGHTAFEPLLITKSSSAHDVDLRLMAGKWRDIPGSSPGLTQMRMLFEAVSNRGGHANHGRPTPIQLFPRLLYDRVEDKLTARPGTAAGVEYYCRRSLCRREWSRGWDDAPLASAERARLKGNANSLQLAGIFGRHSAGNRRTGRLFGVLGADPRCGRKFCH